MYIILSNVYTCIFTDSVNSFEGIEDHDDVEYVVLCCLCLGTYTVICYITGFKFETRYAINFLIRF